MQMTQRTPLPILWLALALGVLTGAAAQNRAELPSPEQFLGFRVGTDRKLATWPQVVDYMQRAGRASDRVRVSELGKSTLGNPFLLLEISSPKNLARRAEIMTDQRQLAYPYQLSEEEAAKIAARNPIVCLISMTIHSSEIGSTQMALELVHRLATEKSPSVQRLLDSVYFLLVPSLNPDGQVLVVDWYQKNVGTEFEHAPLPWLYHPYTGHDLNRDAYMLTQIESRMLTRLLYQDWFPLIYLDEHQMGSSGPRIFVPPFADPVNPNQDPLVLAQSSLMGMHMFTALNAAGYTGVQYGEQYNWWWQGSFKNGGWYHNMVGLLTEVASARIATPLEQETAPLGRFPGAPAAGSESPARTAADPRKPIPPPRDTWSRTNYPRPWLGGTWRLRDIIDYELVITYALLEAAADQRETFQRNFYRLNRKAIDTGRRGDPFAYVLPPDQHDPGAAAKLLELLDLTGIELFRATEAFEADGKRYPAGTMIVPMGQPFRNYAKDLLEPQAYPMKPVPPGRAPERPYDVTGWTLPLQMGVEAVRVKQPFQARMERVSPVEKPEGRVTGPADAALFLLPHTWNASAAAVNRLLKEPGVEVFWAAEPFEAGGASRPAGTILVRGSGLREKLERIAKETHVVVTGVREPVSVPAWKLRPPRIALCKPWTANMDEGWTRWVLEQYGFPYTTVHNDEVRAGRLRERFDVLLIASQSRASILNGNRGEWVRPEHRGGLGAEGSRAVQEFVREGGTLVTLDDACDFAIDELKLPVRNSLRGVPPEQFYCPGAILETFVDDRHPLGYGMPARTSVYFLNSPAFELTGPLGEGAARAVARYPATNPLQSGWIGGPEHLFNRLGVVEAPVGKGRAVLLGFRAQFRGQPHATFKLLFNALHWSAAELRR
jgi:hypothetical protein